MQSERENRVVIVGGGATGALLACHLLRDRGTPLRVTLIEKRHDVGVGLAYGDAGRGHLLNVRVGNMSAFPDDPDHFWRWLVACGAVAENACHDRFCFAPRRLYGRYLASIVDALSSDPAREGALRIVEDECVAIRETPSGVSVTTADGTEHAGHIAVLATGHETPAGDSADVFADPWSVDIASLPADAPVLVVGTGLTMVDFVLALIDARHTGPIHAISRRGLLPHAHRHIEPQRIAAEDVPFGAGPVGLLCWLRARVDAAVKQGGDWRSVMDGLRPYTQQLWQTLARDEQRRFLTHARAYWDVHRHRMAPEIAARIEAAIASGRVNVITGKICTVEPDTAGGRVVYRRRGRGATETLHVAKIVECKGVVTDPTDTSNPVLRSLFAQGLARPDPLRIGIQVTDDCAIVSHAGVPSRRLFAAGPLTRAGFWEIVAVPDIRVQCARLARHIAGRMESDARDAPEIDSPPLSSDAKAAAKVEASLFANR